MVSFSSISYKDHSGLRSEILGLTSLATSFYKALVVDMIAISFTIKEKLVKTPPILNKTSIMVEIEI